MSKRALNKDLFREIKKTQGRFFSIFMLVMIAVCFLFGLRMAAPDMKASMDAYLDQHGLMDVHVMSTLGLTQADVDALAQTEGAQVVEGAYTADALASSPSSQDTLVVKAISLSENGVNQPAVTQGRLPETSEECLVETGLLDSLGLSLGDQITLDTGSGAYEDALAHTTFTIVGVGQSPLYVSLSRGTSTLGNGTVASIVVLDSGAYDMDAYTDLYLRLEGADALNAYEDAYEALVESYTDSLAALQAEREEARTQEIKAEAQAELDDAQKEYDDAKAEVDQELADAWQELTDARQELDDGWVEYQDGLSDLEEARQEIADGWAELQKGKKTLEDGESDYAQGLKKYQSGKAAYEDGLKQYNSGKAQYDSAVAAYNSGKAQLDSQKAQYEEGEAAYAGGLTQYEQGEDAYAGGLSQYEAGEAAYQEGFSQYEAGETAYADGLAQYEQGAAAYADALSQYEAGEAAYQEGLSQYQAAEEEYATREAEYQAGEAAYQQGKTEYDQGEAAYAAYQQSLSDYETQRAQYESAVTVHKQAAAAYEQEKANYDQQLAALEAGKADGSLTQEEIAQREAELAALQSQLNETKGQLETEQASLEQTGAALEAGKGALDGQAETMAALRTQLDQSKETLAATRPQLDGAKAQLEEGRVQLDETKATLEAKGAELEAGKAALDATQAQLSESKAALETSRTQLDESKTTLEASRTQLDESRTTLEESRAQLDESKATLEGTRTQLDEAKSALSQAEEELAGGKSQLDENGKVLAASRETLAKSKNQLDQAKGQLSDARQDLDQGWADYHSGKAELEDAESQAADGEAELADALVTLNDGEQDYADGLQEYEDGKAEAEEELADARQKIADGQAEIDEIAGAEWYLLDRNANTGFASYAQDAERMTKLATIFPSVFFLVAALVCLNAMTRMVEEQRVEVGGLKALGYSKLDIARKYVGYGLLASLSGSVIGLILGGIGIPYVIVTCWKIMYDFPGVTLTFSWPVALACTLAAVGSCTVAVLVATLNALRATPAALMRPKAPPAGKRVWMEHLPFLWKRMSFTQKVTARNLFRYKKRFWMTVIGIAGCTGLMISGLGLRDSIMDVVDLQFENVSTYTAILYQDEDATEAEMDALTQALDQENEITAWTRCCLTTVTLESDSYSLTGNLLAAEQPEDLDPFWHFRDRVTQEPVELTGSGALLSEKTAELLGLSVGDAITVENDGHRVQVTISGLVENYVQHYLFLTADTYEAVFGQPAEQDQILLSYPEEADWEGIGSRLLELDQVTGIFYVKDSMDLIRRQLDGVYPAVIIIICAAAALAFVVLYNLSTINITERLRELATLKVLGFRDREMQDYVFRENLILTLIGMAFGLVLGFLFHSYLVTTVEVELVMFGRKVHITSYLTALALTMIFALFVNLVAGKKLKKIDMVESLKTVE